MEKIQVLFEGEDKFQIPSSSASEKCWHAIRWMHEGENFEKVFDPPTYGVVLLNQKGFLAIDLYANKKRMGDPVSYNAKGEEVFRFKMPYAVTDVWSYAYFILKDLDGEKAELWFSFLYQHKDIKSWRDYRVVLDLKTGKLEGPYQTRM